MKTATEEQTKEIEKLYEKYSTLVEQTKWLDYAEKRGKKAACSRAYTKLVKYIESVTDESSSIVIYRLINPEVVG